MTFKYLLLLLHPSLLQDNFPRVMTFIEWNFPKGRERKFSIKISSLFSHFWTILHKATPFNVNIVLTYIYIYMLFLFEISFFSVCHEIIMIWGICILLCSIYVCVLILEAKSTCLEKKKKIGRKFPPKNTKTSASSWNYISSDCHKILITCMVA